MPPNDRLIETIILVDLLQGQEAAISWVNSVSLQNRWVSVITYFELLARCRNRREQRTAAREMRHYRLLHLTEGTSRMALAWFERFHLSHGVGVLDRLIGATALRHHLILATLTTKHFVSFSGLPAEPHLASVQ
jgi:predicted nucleic acid-binding protein